MNESRKCMGKIMNKISEKDIDKTFTSWYDMFIWKNVKLCEKEKSDETSDEI